MHCLFENNTKILVDEIGYEYVFRNYLAVGYCEHGTEVTCSTTGDISSLHKQINILRSCVHGVKYSKHIYGFVFKSF
jgi:hypothetical protein